MVVVRKVPLALDTAERHCLVLSVRMQIKLTCL